MRRLVKAAFAGQPVGLFQQLQGVNNIGPEIGLAVVAFPARERRAPHCAPHRQQHHGGKQRDQHPHHHIPVFGHGAPHRAQQPGDPFEQVGQPVRSGVRHVEGLDLHGRELDIAIAAHGGPLARKIAVFRKVGRCRSAHAACGGMAGGAKQLARQRCWTLGPDCAQPRLAPIWRA